MQGGDDDLARHCLTDLRLTMLIPLLMSSDTLMMRRRAVVLGAPAALVSLPAVAQAATKDKLAFDYAMSSTGVKWSEIKEGSDTGLFLGTKGAEVTIDYIMSRQGGYQIHSTLRAGVPFVWKLGEGSVIAGLEQAVLGGGGMPPMKVGGARRIVVPQTMGYGTQTGAGSLLKEVGPIPPDFTWIDQTNDQVNSYRRFKDIYQNVNRLDQPDLVLDVKLRQVTPPPAPVPSVAGSATAAPASEPAASPVVEGAS
tara:strand:- start:3 stop:761 length:759 start_codon:yes stop_codon:yes gene_type:complete